MLTTRALNSFRLEFLVGAHTQRQLTAGAHQDDVWLTAGRVSQDIGSFGDSGGGRVFGAVESGHGLTRQHQGGG